MMDDLLLLAIIAFIVYMLLRMLETWHERYAWRKATEEAHRMMQERYGVVKRRGKWEKMDEN